MWLLLGALNAAACFAVLHTCLKGKNEDLGEDDELLVIHYSLCSQSDSCEFSDSTYEYHGLSPGEGIKCIHGKEWTENQEQILKEWYGAVVWVGFPIGECLKYKEIQHNFFELPLFPHLTILRNIRRGEKIKQD